MIYEYQALNRKGENVTDVIDAANPERARAKLRSQGLYVVRIAPHISSQKKTVVREQKSVSHFFNNLSYKISLRMSRRQVGIFSRQLSTLLGAGMPLLRAINDILEQTDNQNFKHVIADIKEKLEGGSSFSNCLMHHKIVFSDMYINMVRVGENLGSLDQVIARLADIEEKNNILKGKISTVMWYPAFMMLFATAVVVFIMVKIIPSLSQMFIEMGAQLPLPTRIVMAASSFLANFWPLLIIGFIVAGWFYRRYSSTPEGRLKIDELKLKLPLFNRLYRKLVILRMTQNLGILLNNNVDILRSFEIVKKIVSNVVIEKQIEEAAKKIKEGAPVSRAFGNNSFLPKLVIGMISAGEASDSLDTMLLNIGKVYETELDLTINSLTGLIEPIIILIMGGVVGLIVISVMLPMLEMNLLVQ